MATERILIAACKGAEMWNPWQRQDSNAVNMTLTFPNESRSYDATRAAVRFWGYDRSMENTFFVSADALKRIQPNLQPDEAGLLRAFDSNLDLIRAAAAKVYAGGRKGSYDLSVAHF